MFYYPSVTGTTKQICTWLVTFLSVYFIHIWLIPPPSFSSSSSSSASLLPDSTWIRILRTVIRFCPNLSSHSISIKGRLTPVFWSSFVIVSNLCSARIFSWLKCQRFKPFYKIMSDFGRICSQSVFKSWVKLSFLTAYSLGSLMLTFLQGAPRIALWSKTGHIKWL